MYATNLIEQGENPKVVQELLGHADPAFTLKIYAKAIDEAKVKANDKLAGLFKIK